MSGRPGLPPPPPEAETATSRPRRYTFGDLDLEALTRYRRRYQTENLGSPLNGYDAVPVLQGPGAYRRERSTDRAGITVAGLLLFGARDALRE